VTRVHVVMYSVLLLICCASSQAQQTMPTNTNAVVPPLINFSGVLADGNGKPLISVTGVTFLLYKEQQGGAPLWMETRNVAPDNNGGYSVMLGSTSNTGLPGDIFVAGAARWLAVQPQGQQEYPRVLLLSVPYALKAADAQTLGGLPASAFLLAAPSNNGAGTSTDGSGTNPAVAPPSGSENVTTTGGTVSFLPLSDSTSDIISSTIFQGGSGSTAKIGIGTTTPSSTLDVKGGATVRGLLYLPISGTATATAGQDSQALDLAASAFDSSTGAAVSQTFQWRAEPEGNNTSNPAGTLNLLFGSGAATPSETGLNIARNGKITFATGQTFPGLGTITGVTAGTDLTGGGTTGAVTLNVDTTKIPQLTTANTFTGNQTVNGTLTASAFSGNGSALTNVSAADALKFAGLPSNAYAQLVSCPNGS